MPLSTEVYVMVIFIVGLPFFYALLHDSDMRGRRFFMLAYVCLTLSNIFTVIEEFRFNYVFNLCEHFFISLGSMLLLIAVLKFTAKKIHTNKTQYTDGLGG